MDTCQDDIFLPKDTTIPTLGEAKIKNPIKFGRFVEDEDAVLVNISRKSIDKCNKNNGKSTKKPDFTFSNPPDLAARSISTPPKPNVPWSPVAGCAPA